MSEEKKKKKICEMAGLMPCRFCPLCPARTCARAKDTPCGKEFLRRANAPAEEEAHR